MIEPSRVISDGNDVDVLRYGMSFGGFGRWVPGAGFGTEDDAEGTRIMRGQPSTFVFFVEFEKHIFCMRFWNPMMKSMGTDVLLFIF